MNHTYADSVTSPTCGAALPFEPGPRLADARCQRVAEHQGPHCWREAVDRSPAMWSQDGSAIVSPEGRRLVGLEDLTDVDGTVWQ